MELPKNSQEIFRGKYLLFCVLKDFFVGNLTIVIVDEKYRVLLGKELREKVGIEKGEELLAVPFHGGIILLSLKGKRFEGSLEGFGFDEEKHEASKYLFGEGK